MFTPTIYIPDCNLEAELISLDELKLHHLKNVLRIKNEDNVNISTGKGKLLIGNLSNNNVKVSSKMNYLRNHEITILFGEAYRYEYLYFQRHLFEWGFYN